MSAPTTLPASPHNAFRDREATGTPNKCPARRTLGELTPKALNAAKTNNTAVEQLETLKNRSPLKQVQTLSPARQMDTENMSELHYPGFGRKRPITEVDGAVAREESSGYTYRPFDERDGSIQQAFRPSVIARMREDPSTYLVSFEGDDSEEIVPEPEAPVSQETNVSFSSLVNYNPDGSSSQARVSPPPQEVPEPSPPVNTSNTAAPTERKQRAEALRLRLRMAMYKVQTNQTEIPLANLKLPASSATTKPLSANSPKPSTLTTETSISTTDSSLTSTSTVPSITFSRALSSPAAKPPTKLQLLPAPILLPTAYSSRFITEAGIFPSSPPGSISPSQTHIHPPDLSPSHSFVTPIAQRRAFEQLSSPPGSAERVGGVNTGLRLNRRFEEGELTSSVVKGRAASGLIELMNSARR